MNFLFGTNPRLLFFGFILVSSGAYAGTACSPGSTVRIACTMECLNTYKEAVKKAGEARGVKVEIITLQGNSNIDLAQPQKSFDAMLSPGGHDILPEYFLRNADSEEAKGLLAHMRKLYYADGLGHTSEEGKKRDKFEFEMAQRYLHDSHYRNLPFLGVCYGMQMLGAAIGLPLYVDMEKDIGIKARRQVSDPIQLIDTNSLVAHLISGSFSGEKNHHQALNYAYWKKHKQDFPEVTFTASSHEDIIPEVMELRGRPFLGTQFHPERSEEKTRDGIYGWLLEEACKAASKNN